MTHFRVIPTLRDQAVILPYWEALVIPLWYFSRRWICFQTVPVTVRDGRIWGQLMFSQASVTCWCWHRIHQCLAHLEDRIKYERMDICKRNIKLIWTVTAILILSADCTKSDTLFACPNIFFLIERNIYIFALQSILVGCKLVVAALRILWLSMF